MSVQDSAPSEGSLDPNTAPASEADADTSSHASPEASSEALAAAAEEIPEVPGAAFAALGLEPQLCDAIAALGYEEPTPIQREAIPVLLAGRDVMGLAATGTGKTAAFALPLLQRLAAVPRSDTPRALILVPTRELCMQVAEAVHKYGRGYRTRVLAVYGGAAMAQQLRALERGVDVVVGTPGRALDHINRKALNLSRVAVLVLDEADEMLDMGFEEDLTAIVAATPTEGRQTAMFSATMAPRVARAGENYLRQPARVEVARQALAAGEMPKVRQTVYLVPRAHKTAALSRVLDLEQPTSAIIFCRTRTEADSLTETLAARGFGAEALHGGMGQEARDRVMRRFRGGQLELLVATDVAARGLDVEQVSHVVNYDVPSAPDAYVHRIGRTGRAGREGAAITIAEPRERGLLRNIERVTKQRLDIAPVPTATEIKARRFERTATQLRDVLTAAQAERPVSGEGHSADDGDDALAPYRSVAEMLAGEFDLADVAAAAVRLAHESAGNAPDAADEVEIPSFHERGERSRETRPERPRFERGEGGRGEGSRGEGSRGEGSRGEYARPERPRGEFGRAREGGREGVREGGRDESRPERPRREPTRGGSAGNAKLYVGVGRQSGVRPGDLVGAIANEAGIDAARIGAINIADKFSIVEVPSGDADAVIAALRETTIRGERPVVRHDDGTTSYPPRNETRSYDRSFDRPSPDRGGERGGYRGGERGGAGRGGFGRPSFDRDRAPREETRGGRYFERGDRPAPRDAGPPREDRGYPRPPRPEPREEFGRPEFGRDERPRDERPRDERGGRFGGSGSGGAGGRFERPDRGDRGPRRDGPSSGPPRGGRGGDDDRTERFGPPRRGGRERG